MLDKTINSALSNLRRDLIRNGREGLEHLEALMRIRGIPMLHVMPVSKADCARRGQQLRQIILGTLRDGPRTFLEISTEVLSARPELTPREAAKRTGSVLAKMKNAGVLERDGKVWHLAPRSPFITG